MTDSNDILTLQWNELDLSLIGDKQATRKQSE